MGYVIKVNTSERQHDMQALDNLFLFCTERKCDTKHPIHMLHLRALCSLFGSFHRDERLNAGM